MTEEQHQNHYDYDKPYEPEKAIKGGAFVRNFVVIALLAGMAGLGVMVANTPSTGQLGAPQEQQIAENRLAPAYAPPVAPAPTVEQALPQTSSSAPASRAAPPAAEPEFTPSAPPELPAPANPDMTIPDIVEPLPPSEG